MRRLRSVASPIVFTENRVEVEVSVEEPTAKRVVGPPSWPCIDTFANGDVVPKPALPLPPMMKCGVEVPVSPTANAGVFVACCSTESVAHGVEEPMPTDGLQMPPEPLDTLYTVRIGVPSI